MIIEMELTGKRGEISEYARSVIIKKLDQKNW